MPMVQFRVHPWIGCARIGNSDKAYHLASEFPGHEIFDTTDAFDNSFGSTHLWVGRRKQPGRGEASSGLRFDVAARAEGHD